ncbi:MaoC family dehydratase [Polymorphum gilvum]|uniref:Chain A, (R)-Hydratase n=1 Tax=Polymorphum gilvum (strain LMG 25793 / CGMCC 1.9160 / SL003B-26A1) TaxID=991905 RepID=F2J125_POLGS|nr:MaoC/PaaZ C-terminal domain-containing protein [Polymorphum gilvum]ADZ71971.1 Chain A, (R)-Hydratase [Polymorphum gilvum SL003B-26A1]
MTPPFPIIDTWTPRQADFDAFARVSGDDNPIHVDPDFSARTRFGRTVSHGMLLYTRLHGLVGRHWPGRAQAFQALMFPNPAYADEELVLEIAPKDGAPGHMAVRVTRRADGAECLVGDFTLAGDPAAGDPA